MTKYFKPEGIVVGPVETVGYRHFPATEEFPPCRIYYPAILQPKGKIKSIGWFHDQGIGYFMKGYLYVMGSKSLIVTLLSPIIHIVTFFLRANWIAIPEVSLNAEVDDRKKYPVIVFSHGLTGTGQENSILCSAWAKKGFVVVSVHHMDGSSGCVKLPDGSKLYYDKGPPLTNYDRNYRPKQVLQRANEMKQAYNLLKSTAISEDLKSICDLEKSVAAGFSFGAATTAMVSTLEDHPFKALIFLDGWFHIDIMHSAGIEFKFPAQAFEAGIKLPSLFINSEEFESYTKIWNATVELAGHSSRIHVLQDTTHQNFTDVVFWLPKWLLSKMQIMVGGADGREVHAEIVRKTSDFLEEQFSR
jgi:platelet-activating factor acetylhydrolase